MRIHVIRARTLPAALHQVREAHGEDAIVLDTVENPGGVVIRVGVDMPDAGAPAPTHLASAALAPQQTPEQAPERAPEQTTGGAEPKPAPEDRPAESTVDAAVPPLMAPGANRLDLAADGARPFPGDGPTLETPAPATARPEAAPGRPPDTMPTPAPKPLPIERADPPLLLQSAADKVADALAWHGATPLATRSLLFAVEANDSIDPETALAAALDRVYAFADPDDLPTPLAFVGPPGAGKTATLVKLAAANSMAGADIAIVNADLETAGAIDRLDAFGEALDIEPHLAETATEIEAALDALDPHVAAYVDTNGRAPADEDEISEIAAEIAAAGDGVLVLSAVIAPAEAAELAECFAAAGAKYLVMTQLDIARRIGALLAAADAGGLVVSGVSMGRKVGDGLKPLTPRSLARLILAAPRPLAKPRLRQGDALYRRAAAPGPPRSAAA